MARIQAFRTLTNFQLKGLNAVIDPPLVLERNGPNSEYSPLLAGKRLTVKDNFCTHNLPTTCASNMLRWYHPPFTATVVQRLITQGMILAGKVNMDEFAMGTGTADSIHGPCRNPWLYDTFSDAQGLASDWYIPGGSSGGSAVAVAAGLSFASLGSDTGGSVRNPAAYCGVVGVKPTYGLLSRYGLIPLVNSLDVPGIVTKTVSDAALILNATAGHDPMDSTTVKRRFKPVQLPEVDKIDISHYRIGIPREYFPPGLSSQIADAWRKVSALFSDSGAHVKSVSLPHTQYSIACYSILCCCEVASNMARYDGTQFGHRAAGGTSTEELYAKTRQQGFNSVVRGRILSGNFFLLRENYQKYYLRALKLWRLVRNDFIEAFKEVDILLTPTVLSEPLLYSQFIQKDNRTRTQEDDVLTQPMNLAGVPALTLPIELSPKGLPVSLQLSGPAFTEDRLLTVAKWLEHSVDFANTVKTETNSTLDSK